MSYLKDLLHNYRYYKKIREKYPYIDKNEGRLSSDPQYKYPLSSTFNGQNVLNLGCGRSIYTSPNVVNLDCVAAPGINVVWDLGKTPLPLPSNHFDFILANHVLEHVPNWFECFKELCRVLKPGGKLEIWIPPVSSDSAFTYRDHINRIGDLSFGGIDFFRAPGTNLSAEEDFKNLGEASKIRIVEKKIRTIVKWWVLFAPQSLQEWMTNHLRNIVSEVGYIFIKRKTI